MLIQIVLLAGAFSGAQVEWAVPAGPKLEPLVHASANVRVAVTKPFGFTPLHRDSTYPPSNPSLVIGLGMFRAECIHFQGLKRGSILEGAESTAAGLDARNLLVESLEDATCRLKSDDPRPDTGALHGCH